MNRFTRIWNILTSLFTIIVSIIMLAIPDLGYVFATLILGCVLLLNGMKQLIYFFSMGIHMIGGKLILYRALITLDIGIFTITIHGTGQRYIMFYFILYYMFVGFISIFRALEARKLEAGFWKFNFVNGIYDMVIALICFINSNSESVMLNIFCFGLIVSAITRIGIALRKSAIIYIQ